MNSNNFQLIGFDNFFFFHEIFVKIAYTKFFKNTRFTGVMVLKIRFFQIIDRRRGIINNTAGRGTERTILYRKINEQSLISAQNWSGELPMGLSIYIY